MKSIILNFATAFSNLCDIIPWHTYDLVDISLDDMLYDTVYEPILIHIKQEKTYETN